MIQALVGGGYDFEDVNDAFVTPDAKNRADGGYR